MSAVLRCRRPDGWTARGRPTIVAGAEPPPTSWPPPQGTYWPGPTTTGPRPGRVLKRWDGDYRITKPGELVEDLDIYGRIIVTNTGTNAFVRNCIVRGPGKSHTGGFTACITSTSSSLRGLLIEDTRIDCTGRENPLVDGLRESDYIARRIEITRTCDGVSFVTQTGNQLVEDSWLHDGYYAEWPKGAAGWPSTPSDARVHGDAFQFQRGKNITVRNNNIGGWRAPGPYHKSPYTTVDEAMVAKKDAAEDYENSCFMIKQEVSTSAADRLENVLIEHNRLSGGAACINLSYDRENTLESVTIRDNVFPRSTWDAENKAVTGLPQIYIIRDTAITATLSNNVFEDTGAPVPITKGK